MPGGKAKFTKKQDRQAKHVADSEKEKGMDPKKAKRVGYATVNKQKSKRKVSARRKANQKKSDDDANRRKRNKGRS
jgi:hypothetical protein